MNRIEHDSLGPVSIGEKNIWGAQTERTRENFKAGTPVPLLVVYALTQIKKAAAKTHQSLKLLTPLKAKAIIIACDEILKGKWDDQFPVSVFQSGSGTQTNMNVNEVIANRAHQLLDGKLSDTTRLVHPNDDVNKSQSTNDTFPAAMHMALHRALTLELLPVLIGFEKTLIKKSKAFKNNIKVGRTHLMDAVPISFGQEFSGYAAQIATTRRAIEDSLKNLRELPLGGTAVGTGLNAPKQFAELTVKNIRTDTKEPFMVAKNTFAHMAAHEAEVLTSSALKVLAVALTKIANDIRLGASGPHTGFADIIISDNEPGSSIMPGKVNPTQAESMLMVCQRVIGNDLTVTLGGMNGQFELNVSKPLIIATVLESVDLLTQAIVSFDAKCVSGIKINSKKSLENLDRSLMNVTALNTRIGYERAAKAVQQAKKEGKTLRQVILEQKLLTEKEFDQVMNYTKLV